MDDKDFEKFKKRLSDHLYNEAELSTVILNELSEEQSKELQAFMRNHPYPKAMKEIRKMWANAKERRGK